MDQYVSLKKREAFFSLCSDVLDRNQYFSFMYFQTKKTLKK